MLSWQFRLGLQDESHRPMQVAFVAPEGIGIQTAMGCLPFIPGRVVLVWRCCLDEAKRGQEFRRFDLILSGEANDEAANRERVESSNLADGASGVD